MMDEIRQEAANIRTEEIALRMLTKGFYAKEVSEITELSIETLEDLTANHQPK